MDNSSTSSFNLKALALRFVILVAVVFCLDQTFGLVLGKLHGRTREGDFGGCINLVLAQRNDVVVFGSSRAKHHYMPEVLEDVTGRSFFNAGIDAQTILCHFGIAQLVFDEYTPEMVILDLNTEDIRKTGNHGHYDKLSVLLPFYDRGNALLNALLLERSKYERLKLVSGIYPYNSMLLPLIKYTLKPTAAGTSAKKGFTPYYGSDVLEIVRLEEMNEAAGALTEPEVDPEYAAVLRKFVESAREHGVRVVVCLGPLWEKTGQDLANDEVMLAAYRALLEELEVPIVQVDRNTDAEFEDPELFKDRIHLNSKGAPLFSAKLGEKLKPFIAEKEIR